MEDESQKYSRLLRAYVATLTEVALTISLEEDPRTDEEGKPQLAELLNELWKVLEVLDAEALHTIRKIVAQLARHNTAVISLELKSH